ncbi:acetyltransferase [Aliikangiella marina]|uniref:Acetyltransferase n=1 Tax=Aliikangiella marina TaxID=1712262 RepID=A0A545TIU5_9GAMM|nr:acetyltransferase [Aliikangiella marina]TQV77101.1 acetyltransferase [Aliikangiella marina]
MFLKERGSGHLVEVLEVEQLINPQSKLILGRYSIGEADQDDDEFDKSDLIFMSGEELPSCWVN